MGKRSTFERVEDDFYPTPFPALWPLLAYLQPGTEFIEPCAGDGRLVDMLVAHGLVCLDAIDINPRRGDIEEGDARTIQWEEPSLFITNPPWETRKHKGEAFHKIIGNLVPQSPAWLLAPSSWVDTVQAAKFRPWVKEIVPIGRVKWIEGSANGGKDDSSWFHFDSNYTGQTIHHPRQQMPRSLCVRHG